MQAPVVPQVDNRFDCICEQCRSGVLQLNGRQDILGMPRQNSIIVFLPSIMTRVVYHVKSQFH